MEALTQSLQLAHTNWWAPLLISSSSTLAQISQIKTTKKQTNWLSLLDLRSMEIWTTEILLFWDDANTTDGISSYVSKTKAFLLTHRVILSTKKGDRLCDRQKTQFISKWKCAEPTSAWPKCYLWDHRQQFVPLMNTISQSHVKNLQIIQNKHLKCVICSLRYDQLAEMLIFLAWANHLAPRLIWKCR